MKVHQSLRVNPSSIGNHGFVASKSHRLWDTEEPILVAGVSPLPHSLPISIYGQSVAYDLFNKTDFGPDCDRSHGLQRGLNGTSTSQGQNQLPSNLPEKKEERKRAIWSGNNFVVTEI